MRNIDIEFKTIVIRTGKLDTKIIRREHDDNDMNSTTVTVDATQIYINQSRYTVKGKDMTHLEIDPKDTSRIVIKTCKEERSFEFLEAIDAGGVHFADFCRRVQRIYAKYHSSVALSSSELAVSRNVEKTAARGRRAAPIRGSFGKSNSRFVPHQRKPQPIPWQEQSSDDELCNDGGGTNLQDSEVISDSINDNEETSSDGEKEVSTNSIKQKVDIQVKDDDSIMIDANESFEEIEAELSKKRKTRRGRLRKKILEETDPDSDVDFFAETPVHTTPSTQRLVSPSETLTDLTDQKVQKQQQNVGKGTLSHFFRPNQTTKSFDPANRSAGTLTPVRHASSTHLVKSAQKLFLMSDEEWLKTSPRSSPETKQLKTLGFAAPLSHLELPDDPISTSQSSGDASPTKTTSVMRALKRPRSMFLSKLDFDNTARSALKNTVNGDRKSESITTSPTEQIFRPIIKHPFRGMRNLGNTCYINASLQMLYTAFDFIKAIHNRGGPLTKSVVSVAMELQDVSSSTSPVNPNLVKEAMDQRTNKFAGFEQRDAHEFLSELVDGIHEELRTEQNSCDGLKGTLPTDDFRLIVQVSLMCNSCGYTRSKEEVYRHLSLDIVGEDTTDIQKNDQFVSHGSVKHSLARFFQPETREIKCEKCEMGTHASQTIKVLSMPKFLLLHLKRFIFVEKSAIDEKTSSMQLNTGELTQYVFQKNKMPILIADSVSLDSFALTSISSSDPNCYKLSSVVHHLGSRASSGHYTADTIRFTEEKMQEINHSTSSDMFTSLTSELSLGPHSRDKRLKWVTFDDNNFCVTSYETVAADPGKQSTAYMLLYCLDN